MHLVGPASALSIEHGEVILARLIVELEQSSSSSSRVRLEVLGLGVLRCEKVSNWHFFVDGVRGLPEQSNAPYAAVPLTSSSGVSLLRDRGFVTAPVSGLR